MATKAQIIGLTKRIEALARVSTKPRLVVVDPAETLEQAAQRSGVLPAHGIFVRTGVPRASGGQLDG
jgi:hypothetical protein